MIKKYKSAIFVFKESMSPLTVLAMVLQLAVPVLFLIPASANAVVPTETVIFENGFEEEPPFDEWTSADNKWQRSGGNVYEGVKKAKIEGNTQGNQILLKEISTEGYENITLSFYYWMPSNSSLEPADYINAEWFDGIKWFELQTFSDGDEINEWTLWSVVLPDEANDNPYFAIRFRANLDAGNDRFDLDAVKITGEEIADTPPPAECVPGVNLISNGSFETPEVMTSQNWNIFPNGTGGLGWAVEWMSGYDGAPEEANLELHKDGLLGVSPADGNQWAELDTDWEGPTDSMNGEEASVAISQDIPTLAGKNYELSFSFKSRPSTDASQNVLGVLWSGSELGELDSDDTDGDWTSFVYDLEGDGTTKTLRFEDRGIPDSLGTYLDNISLVCTGNSCEETSGKIWSDTNTAITEIEVDGATTTPTGTYVVTPTAITDQYWTADVGNTNAKWIWSEEPVTNWDVDKYVTFEKTFNVTGDPESGVLNIATDNSYEVWLNGNSVGEDSTENNHQIGTQDSFDVSSLLLNGSNTLKVKVKNWSQVNGSALNNPGGLLFALSWTAEDCGDSPPPPEPENDVNVTVYKYLDGEKLTKGDGLSFPIHVSWSSNNGQSGYGSGDTALDEGNNFTYTKSVIAPGVFGINEIVGGNILANGESCELGKYRIAGYTKGDTLDEAESAEVNEYQGIGIDPWSNDKFVIIWNDTCLAPACEDGPAWADEIVNDSNQGNRKNGTPILSARSNSEVILGEPDGNGASSTGFYSLGERGSVTVKFSIYVKNVEGDDLSFHEITNGRNSYPEETAQVEVSQNGGDWYEVGTVSSKAVDGVDYLDFDNTGLSWIQYVRVTDTTDFTIHTDDSDGYDLDAVDATYALCDLPEDNNKDEECTENCENDDDQDDDKKEEDNDEDGIHHHAGQFEPNRRGLILGAYTDFTGATYYGSFGGSNSGQMKQLWDILNNLSILLNQYLNTLNA